MDIDARNAKEQAFVNTTRSAVDARIVEIPVNMGGVSVNAGTVGEPAFATMVRDVTTASYVVGQASAFIVDNAVFARTVEGQAYANMGGSNLYAKNAEEQASVSMASDAADVRNVSS